MGSISLSFQVKIQKLLEAFSGFLKLSMATRNTYKNYKHAVKIDPTLGR